MNAPTPGSSSKRDWAHARRPSFTVSILNLFGVHVAKAVFGTSCGLPATTWNTDPISVNVKASTGKRSAIWSDSSLFTRSTQAL